MAGVLTTESKVTCSHSGTVGTSGSSKLTVNGYGVLVKAGISGKTISLCSTVTDTSGNTQCATVSSVITGEATKLTCGGAAVVLDTLTGQTSGTTKADGVGTLKATVVQTKLTAT